jgi:two-component system sensor histidine kinase DegS
MVKEYLEKTRNQFLQERSSLKEREVELQNRLKEHISFIQLLEESNDPNYAAFTPREVSGFYKQKIDELKQEQNEISEELNQLKIQILNVNCNIDEIDSVIRVTEGLLSGGQCSPEKNKFYILETQEKERQRIARDLHDSTVQTLTSLVHKSELCSNLLDNDPVRCKLELSLLNKYLRDVINDIRNLIYDLRPMSFDDIGFDVTVDRYLDKINHGSTDFSYQIIGEPYHINSVTALTLLRVIQEACSNAMKHGNAKKVDIVLEYCPNSIHLVIDDDGDGFDLSNSTPDVSREDNSGFGLSMMKERIFLLSGNIQFSSKPGQGFHIDVNVPIKFMEENVC